MSARIQVQGDTQQLDVQVYQARHTGVHTKELRDALARVHTAVMAHMVTASYVDVYRKCLARSDATFISLVPPPPPHTQAHMEQLERALADAQELALKAAAQNEDVKITNSQRLFMQSFYTLQLRALDAAWKCLVWLTAESRKTLADNDALMKLTREKCAQWRATWNDTMHPSIRVTTESPQDVVTAWCESSPVGPLSSKLAAQANALERAMTACVSSVRGVYAQFEAAADTHLHDIESLKAAEIAKLDARAVPVEVEGVWLKNYLAHVRDLLASHPELNLFL